VLTSAVIRFPARRSTCIWLMPDDDGAWLVLAGSHGWLHGDIADAHADACWLSRNLHLPVRAIERNQQGERP
jgi:hypothetical protein